LRRLIWRFGCRRAKEEDSRAACRLLSGLGDPEPENNLIYECLRDVILADSSESSRNAEPLMSFSNPEITHRESFPKSECFFTDPTENSFAQDVAAVPEDIDLPE
jgi:hypothetical protein